MAATTVTLPDLSNDNLARPRQATMYVLFIPSAGRVPYIFLRPGIRTVFGRGNSSTAEQPDVDLSLYGAREKGVSRIHAAIEFQEDGIGIMDLSSSNGTYLHGQRLMPHQCYPLQDREEIRFGKLVIYLLFQ